MDNKQLQQSISLFYSRLPSDAQAYFAAQTWMQTLEKINKEFNLNEEQIKTLATETTLVLLGIIHSGEFEGIIRNEMNLPASLSEQIISIINTKILSPFRTQLTTSYENNINSEFIDFGSAEQKQLDPQFEKLPIEVQNAIANSNYQKKIYTIGEKYKLPINVQSTLEQNTIKLMKGELNPTSYENMLALESNLPNTKVQEIVNDINNEIMKNIRMGVIQKPSFDIRVPEEEEVPIPPYAMGIENKTKEENTYHGHEIYKETGVEILDGKIKEEISIPKTEVVNEIPNVIKKEQAIFNANLDVATNTKNIIANKLQSATNSVLKHDPYHEEI